MIQKEVSLSNEFKTQTTKAITSIIIFAFVYLLTFFLAIGLTVLCVYGAISLVAAHPRFFTLALGVGLASIGFLVLFFLLKFLFKKNKKDRGHLLEIKKVDQPHLFEMIDEIVNEVGTQFPKKVYLSHEVNASVFYDSNFWSMILPVKKNLMIGLGLVNCISRNELKAILSHEFGHFSQKTMKVGSFVYNVNQIIHNMLYENESYDKMIQSWANASGYFTVFVIIAVKIVEGIQWLLKLMYEFVNKNYLGLSREMEFHADEIAANVTGNEPLENSLLRMNLSDYSFNSVLSFYEGKIEQCLKSKNVFLDQWFVLNFISKEDNIEIKNRLPNVTIEELNKFNKSKLVIKDQWASHPSTEDRVERLKKLNLKKTTNNDQLANEIFQNLNALQEKLTDILFSNVMYSKEPDFTTHENFKIEFKEKFLENTFPKIFNQYYDNKSPIQFEVSNVSLSNNQIHFRNLFSDEKVNLVYQSIALQNDIATINQISNNGLKLKTFDYDGKKYSKKEGAKLSISLKKELETINEEIEQNDKQIFQYFLNAESDNSGEITKLEKLYKNLLEFDNYYDEKISVYNELMSKLDFINYNTPFDKIKTNFVNIKPLENKLKASIKELLEQNKYNNNLKLEVKECFNSFTEKELKYFLGERYIDENLEILFTSLNNYYFLLSEGFLINKRELLNYQASLIKE
ncbi:M48 family metallopeptidase [Hanstruepera flava]|uniref:M48 family metallopeptidase n=1 Tax=Hanstruepera flava TaxID=2930218 RepID=UPI002028C1D9|nr:M48 family metallopeptidase [Hanstruepera flava]